MKPIKAGGSSSAASCKAPTACNPSKASVVSNPKKVAQTVVPLGWRRHHATLLRGLKAATTSVRKAITISAPSFNNDTVLMQVSLKDPVTIGLVRKAKARMSCTCMTCGKAGKPRQVGFYTGVLCASCYMERRLRVQLRLVFSAITARRKSGCGVVSEGDVPSLIRGLVADEAWRSMSGPPRPGEAAVRVRYLTLAQCEQLMPLLRALQDAINTEMDVPDVAC